MKSVFFTLLTFFFMQSLHSAVVLIDADTRNGFFDTGAASPWSGALSIGDANPPPQSEDFFGVLSGTRSSGVGTVRAETWNLFPMSLSDGQQIVVSLYARIPDSLAFDSLSVRIWDASLVSYSLTLLSSGSLSDSNWTFYDYSVTLPDTFNDVGSSRLVIGMSISNGLPDTIYSGYIDSVTTLQIPEPTVATFLLGAGLIVLVFHRGRFCRN